MNAAEKVKFTATKSSGEVSGLLLLPENAKALYVFAHGAGAPMNHPFMNNAAQHLASEGIGTFRYNFPYTEKKQKRIDPLPVLLQTVCSAVKTARTYALEIPLIAGGKSMGGRMTSQAAAQEALDGVSGLVFFGFPLHPPGKKSTDRAEHLYNIKIPMLFLQGSRDSLASPELLRPVLKKIGGSAKLYMIEGADHSFHMLKSSGRIDDDVLRELARSTSDWLKYIKPRMP